MRYIDGAQQYLIAVSSAVIHFRGHPIVIPKPAYSLTKASGTLALSMVADDIAADEMQIIIFHPGLVYGAEAERDGIPEHGVFEFDDGKHTLSFIRQFSGGIIY
jgi:nucleoside-diphosphate-sugar epimerase